MVCTVLHVAKEAGLYDVIGNPRDFAFSFVAVLRYDTTVHWLCVCACVCVCVRVCACVSVSV